VCHVGEVDRGSWVVGYSTIMRLWSVLVGGLATLVLDMGSQVILRYTCLCLDLIAGPCSGKCGSFA
jgi:hypothetical protein